MSHIGPVPTDFHEAVIFKSCHGFMTWYLLCFRPRCFQMHIFEVYGRNQQDVRREVMQIRGGITSRNALFALFVPVSDFQLSVIFESPSSLPVSVSGL